MNVTITGNLGAGKTSVCNELKKMGYENAIPGGRMEEHEGPLKKMK